MTDAHTTWTELIPLRSKSKRDVATGIVNGWIMRHDCFLSLLTDQGKEFHNEVLDEVCSTLRIKKLTSTGYRPQTNGLCERQNRTVHQTIRIFLKKISTNKWPELLPAIQHAINTSPREGSGLWTFRSSPEAIQGFVPYRTRARRRFLRQTLEGARSASCTLPPMATR
jgi:transposase InsO family protein